MVTTCDFSFAEPIVTNSLIQISDVEGLGPVYQFVNNLKYDLEYKKYAAMNIFTHQEIENILWCRHGLSR